MTDGQTETDVQMDGLMDKPTGQTDKDGENRGMGEREGQTDNRLAEGWRDRQQTCRPMDRQMDTEGWADRGTDGWTDGQSICPLVCLCISFSHHLSFCLSPSVYCLSIVPPSLPLHIVHCLVSLSVHLSPCVCVSACLCVVSCSSP